MTREEIEKLKQDCLEAIGGPFDEGQRKWMLYLDAVMDYIDKRIK